MAVTWKGKATNDTANANSGTVATGLGANSMYGFAGNDTLTTLTTTSLSNLAYGGDGHDTITGSSTSTVIDRLFGGNGNDSLIGSGGKDMLNGGTGNDTLATGTGNALLIGDFGNDSLTSGWGNNTLYGGQGNDTMSGGTMASLADKAKDVMKGGDGNDAMTAASYSGVGSVYSNSLYGGAGNDTLTSSALTGTNSAKDVLIGGLGNDSLVGGALNATNTTASYSDSTWSVNVNLTTGAGTSNGGTAATGYGQTNSVTTNSTAAGDILSNVGNVTGSIYKDTLIGNSSANIMHGGGGNDTIDSGTTANTGADQLFGDAGNDTFLMRNATQTADVINGGDGINTMDFSNVTTGVTVNLSALIGGTIVNFSGGGGSGTIVSMDNVIGTGVADTLTAVGGGYVQGGLGDDTILTASVVGAQDTLIGGGGNDLYDLSGNFQRDYISITATSGTVANGDDTIRGFDQGQGDRVYIKLADFGVAVAATASGPAGTAIQVAGTGANAFYTANYGAAVVAGTLNHNLVSISVASDAVVSGSGAVIANAAHAQFLYDDATGILKFDADGTGVGVAITVGHFDLTQMNATVVGNLASHALESADFLFIA